MASLPRLLHRFRRLLAPPGRPSETLGVPASGEDLEAELGPLLIALERVDAEATAIRARGGERAERRREQGRREAAAIVERARGAAEAERARALAAGRAEAEAQGAAAREAAAREVARLRSVRDERVEQLVSEVVECVRRSGR